MFQLKLFLGFQTDEFFRKELQKANPYLVKLFVGQEDYLQAITYEDNHYLGKYLSTFSTIEHIEDLEKHLLSLLKQVAPRYPFAHNPPFLLTLHG